MPKNIVICLDGTGGEYGSRNTNVLLLHQMLVQDATQIAFYDPGVGTFSVKSTLTDAARFWQKVLGLAFGFGLRQNVIDTYSFVMKHYEVGDRLYFYGFSRGAYTARLVAALIHGVGILPRGLENLAPYALRYLQMQKGGLDFERLGGFSKQFRHFDAPPDIFLGLWDTVASISWAFDRQVYAFTTKNKSVSHARHAISIDERRAFFRISKLSEQLPKQDRKQVWFAGVHSDVGGGYPTEETGLAKTALEWMVVESRNQGLKIDDDIAFEIFENAAPDPLGQRHESLSGPWWAAEVWPKRTWNWSRGRWGYRFNLGRRRRFPKEATLHESADVRRQATSYGPSELTDTLKIEARVPFSSQDGSRSLPPWPQPGKKSQPELKPAFSLLNPILAVLSIYGLGAAVVLPLVLFQRAARLDLGGLLTELALWPRWLSERALEIGARIEARPELLAVLLIPLAFLVGRRLLKKPTQG